MLHFTKLKSICIDKHCSILGTLESYEENKSEHLIFSLTYEWVKAGVSHYTRLRTVRSICINKRSSLL